MIATARNIKVIPILIFLYIFILFQLSIPKDCKGNTMCTILKKLVGPGANFRIVGFVGKDAYALTAGFYRIKIYKEFYLEKLQLEVKVTVSSI